MIIDKAELVNLIVSAVNDALKKLYVLPLIKPPANNNETTKKENKQLVTPENLKADIAEVYNLLNKKVIVEEDIKQAFKKDYKTIAISKKAIITPLAKDLANQKKIKLLIKN